MNLGEEETEEVAVVEEVVAEVAEDFRTTSFSP